MKSWIKLSILLALLSARSWAGEYSYTTNNARITITKYNGTNSSVNIPEVINNLPVTHIANLAFNANTNLIEVTIPYGVTNIGNSFVSCVNLVDVTLPNSLTDIGAQAFYNCRKLTSITIPPSVTKIGARVFVSCDSLTGIYCQGDVPDIDSSAFSALKAVVYYLPGRVGWDTTSVYLPTTLWNPQIQTSTNGFGMQNNRFGFTVTGSTNFLVAVEASTNLAVGPWAVIHTDTLTNGVAYFSDTQSTNYLNRFYRLRMP